MSRQEPGACDGVNFLLHHRVLYEISAFGLQDSAVKVSKHVCTYVTYVRINLNLLSEVILALFFNMLVHVRVIWIKYHQHRYQLQGFLCVVCVFTLSPC